MSQIDQTARPDLPGGPTARLNVKATIIAMKQTGIYSDVPDGKRKPKGRERWQVETDGLGTFEVDILIPGVTHNLKDKAIRAQRVRELVRDAALIKAQQALSDHAG